MSSLGSSLGPRGENIILRKITSDSADYGGFGSLILDKLQNDLEYYECGGVSLKTLRIRLTNSAGETINLNGYNWSFSVIFQEMP